MKRLLILLAVLFTLTGCETPDPQSSEDTDTRESPNQAATTPDPETAEATEKAAEKPAEKVAAVEFDDAEYGSDVKEGKLLGGFSFSDSAGKNTLLFIQQTDASDETTTERLTVRHLVTENGEKKVLREFTEIVEDCDADVVLEPKWGDWSVTDVDSDGTGEATFAYTADCTSDISPLTHKVLVSEGGEKYGLRGVTKVKPGPSAEPIGGDFKADEMDAELLKHASDVWSETSKSYGM